jgi:ABC-2 type transport system permease protein
MFPREAMPTLFYYLGDILPATFYMEIMRGIILKGIGIQYLWTQAAALGVFIIGVFTISLVKFSKKIT